MRQDVRITMMAAIIASTMIISGVGRAQILETESARFIGRGRLELGTGFEYQRSSEGSERAMPIAAEYGISDRLSLLVEPIFYTAIRPKHGLRATGVGDVEVTALALVRRESPRWPAIALGMEVKAPTAKDRLIGTGETDVAGYLIASRRFGNLETHANIGYTVLGRPPGTKLANIWNGALAGEYSLTPKILLYGEMLGTTAATAEGGDQAAPGSGVLPEIAGSEVVGTLGFGVRPVPHLLLSLGISYDNNNAWLARPGITLWTR